MYEFHRRGQRAGSVICSVPGAGRGPKLKDTLTETGTLPVAEIKPVTFWLTLTTMTPYHSNMCEF